MKICIAYPPLESEKGIPLLSQNRQFQWFSSPTFIYPVIPAYAATMLKQAGFDVCWLDGIAKQWRYKEWEKQLLQEKPDWLLFETKTPVIKKHWQIINRIKSIKNLQDMKIAVAGDHVTALPEETLKMSKADFVLTGGDYDFLLLNLVKNWPVKNKLEQGIYLRENNKIISTGRFRLNHDLNKLPLVDRELSQWKLYSKKNGNFNKTPGTYIMSGRDCWHRVRGGCTFCSWTSLYPTWRTQKPEKAVAEIEKLVMEYGVKTIFDDSGSFMIGKNLEKFCRLMIKKGLNKKVELGCNMRFGALSSKEYLFMKKAGFGMLLFGLESANQKTLDRINKNLKLEEIEKSCKMAKKAGLKPHITIMLGYPWENEKEALNTVRLGKSLLVKGLADSLQATLIIPYPGTALFAEAREQKWLKTENWDKYDMRRPVLMTKIPEKKMMSMIRNIYEVAFDPRFLARKLAGIRSWKDVRYLFAAGKKVIGHLYDFSFWQK